MRVDTLMNGGSDIIEKKKKKKGKHFINDDHENLSNFSSMKKGKANKNTMKEIMIDVNSDSEVDEEFSMSNKIEIIDEDDNVQRYKHLEDELDIRIGGGLDFYCTFYFVEYFQRMTKLNRKEKKRKSRKPAKKAVIKI